MPTHKHRSTEVDRRNSRPLDIPAQDGGLRIAAGKRQPATEEHPGPDMERHAEKTKGP